MCARLLISQLIFMYSRNLGRLPAFRCEWNLPLPRWQWHRRSISFTSIIECRITGVCLHFQWMDGRWRGQDQWDTRNCRPLDRQMHTSTTICVNICVITVPVFGLGFGLGYLIRVVSNKAHCIRELNKAYQGGFHTDGKTCYLCCFESSTSCI